jgi:hypothetical protein
MHRWGKQKPVRLDEKELKTDLGSGNFIFVGSSCDMWAKVIHSKWILDTLSHCELFYGNTYLFQSKNPEAFVECEDFLPSHVKLCTTIETNRHYPCMGDAPTTQDRSEQMEHIVDIEKYVTIEPIMDFDLKEMIEIVNLCDPIQVHIGADSGNNHLPEPPKEKILELINELQKFTVIDQKRNLGRLLK